MVIIVEGIDRVGKTTLVDMLQKETGFPVYKNSTGFKLESMDNENETDKMLKMLQVCELGNVNIIFDRFHWTDAAYGCVQRGYNVQKAMQNVALIEKKLYEMGAMVVLVRPTDLHKSSEEHGSDLSPHNAIFDTLYDRSMTKRFACNYHNLSKAKDWVMASIRNHNRRVTITLDGKEILEGVRYYARKHL